MNFITKNIENCQVKLCTEETYSDFAVINGSEVDEYIAGLGVKYNKSTPEIQHRTREKKKSS